jgi:hypothetical protein
VSGREQCVFMYGNDVYFYHGSVSFFLDDALYVPFSRPRLSKSCFYAS